MKLIADAMLGRLAKRLRLLGYDVLYDAAFDDNEVIRLALAGDRTILTRDTGLAARPLAGNHLLIRSGDPAEQVRQVLSAFPEPAGGPLTRCSACNAQIRTVPREEVRDLVPQHVFARHTVFHRCSGCGRVYWEGTHVRNMDLAGE